MKKTILASLIAVSSFTSASAFADVELDPIENPPGLPDFQPIVEGPEDPLLAPVEPIDPIDYGMNLRFATDEIEEMLHDQGMTDVEIIQQMKEEALARNPNLEPEKVDSFIRQRVETVVKNTVKVMDKYNEYNPEPKPPVEEDMPIVEPPVEDQPTVQPIHEDTQEYVEARIKREIVEEVREADDAGEMIDEIANLKGEVAGLEQAFQAQGEAAMEYHDNALATTQATVNARPMVTDGSTAFGAGVGAAGDSEAISVGVAHSFEDSNWSASATATGTSETTYVESEFSAGAGVQYTFN
ncbi:putative Trimeric autotransporter adhesin YadA-like C-terminal membrane anchor domain-containing protein [Vibrio crassostreae]|nr:putative Trimeric autotransporter adhesin YadA-like C-terminal membrane anchor domain-containing protein [Vibrio crassostreae]